MEDILLMQFLRKKGIISDTDMHEFHELTSANMAEEPIYLSKTKEAALQHDTSYITESEAKDLVSKMYHIESGRKYIGEKFDMYETKEIYERYKSILPISVNICDIYIAINAQYHDYVKLFKSWFSNDIEQKIIESAIVYWFKDDDQVNKYKWLKHIDEW